MQISQHKIKAHTTALFYNVLEARVKEQSIFCIKSSVYIVPMISYCSLHSYFRCCSLGFEGEMGVVMCQFKTNVKISDDKVSQKMFLSELADI